MLSKNKYVAIMANNPYTILFPAFNKNLFTFASLLFFTQIKYIHYMLFIF